MCLPDRQRAERIEDISRVTAGALGYFEDAFAEQIGGGDFCPRALRPEITVIGRFDFKLHIDSVLIIPGRLGIDSRDLAYVEAHQVHRVTNFQSCGAVGKSEVRRLGFKPAFAFSGVIDVVGKPEYKQRRGQQHEPAHGAFHPAQARAQLRG